MNDKHDDLLDKLFAAARSTKPDMTAIEAHFETRLLARIEERTGQASWPVWTWRLIPWFVTIVIIVGIGSVVYDPARSSDLFATLTSGYDEYQTTSMLA